MHDLNRIAEKSLAALTAGGADSAQCTARFTETHEFNVDGGQFSLFRTLFDNSLSLTALCGGRRGTASVNRFDDESVAAAAESCLEIARSGESDPAWEFAPELENKTFADGTPEAELDLLFDRTKELMDTVAARHPKILMEQMIVTHKKRHTVYRNTNGAAFERTDGDYQIELMYSAHEGERASSFFGSYVCTDDLSRPFYELGCLAEELSDVERQIDTEPLTGKFVGTAVFPPSALSSFLYSILDNFASDSTILDGTSPWRDKLGEVVADSRITLSAAPLDSRVVCGERFTADGYESKNYDIIRNGVLTGLMISKYVSNKTGLPRAKNSSSALVMASGDVPYAEMIAGIERGIIVGRFSGGEPGTSGDFSGVAKNSFLIENGKIKCALSETMISGNLGELLKNVIAISAESVCDGAGVLPYAAFGGVTVSGK